MERKKGKKMGFLENLNNDIEWMDIDDRSVYGTDRALESIESNLSDESITKPPVIRQSDIDSPPPRPIEHDPTVNEKKTLVKEHIRTTKKKDKKEERKKDKKEDKKEEKKEEKKDVNSKPNESDKNE